MVLFPIHCGVHAIGIHRPRKFPSPHKSRAIPADISHRPSNKNMATVALIGVKGNLGYKIFPELVASDAIAKIHVLSRKKRNSGGGKAVDFQVDYSDPASLEKALKGVDAIINTMGTEGDFQKSKKALVDVAAKCGVKLYFPRFDQFGA